jgi:hypothetical protein
MEPITCGQSSPAASRKRKREVKSDAVVAKEAKDAHKDLTKKSLTISMVGNTKR